MSLIGRRFSFIKDDTIYPLIIDDEDDEFLYVRFLFSPSGYSGRHLKCILEKYPLFFQSSQLTLF